MLRNVKWVRVQDANLQGMDNVRKLLTGVSYAAGSTTPELAGVSLAFAKLGGLLLVDAAQKKGVEQQKAVGTALTYTLLADWAQPRTLNRETLPEHDSIIQGTYDALQMMSGDRMKGTIACCRSAAKYSMPPRQDNQAVYHDQLLAHANQALDAIPTAKRLSRPAAE